MKVQVTKRGNRNWVIVMHDDENSNNIIRKVKVKLFCITIKQYYYARISIDNRLWELKVPTIFNIFELIADSAFKHNIADSIEFHYKNEHWKFTYQEASKYKFGLNNVASKVEKLNGSNKC